MRLQRVLSREVEGKKYWKYQVVLPKEELEELGWEAGDDLEAEVQGEKLVLQRDEG